MAVGRGVYRVLMLPKTREILYTIGMGIETSKETPDHGKANPSIVQRLTKGIGSVVSKIGKTLKQDGFMLEQHGQYVHIQPLRLKMGTVVHIKDKGDWHIWERSHISGYVSLVQEVGPKGMQRIDVPEQEIIDSSPELFKK